MSKDPRIIKGTALTRAREEGRAGSSTGDRQSYTSRVVDHLRARGYRLTVGRLTLVSAEKFGFCWGVDKAVEIVREAMEAYPGKRVWILNEIIHNPGVNRDFMIQGAQFIKGKYADPGGFDRVSRDDVAIIPAFSAEVEDVERLKAIGCVIVDTTCPWVLKPHLRTKRNIEAGYTTIIHATLGHDETRATCSLIQHEKGRFVVVRDLDETQVVLDRLAGRNSGAEFLKVLGHAVSVGFDPETDLERVALINQTTMLASESREIGRRIEQTIRDRHGEAGVVDRFRDFDTICNATQENQDAMLDMVSRGDLDLVLVVGGYNSSNTKNLARIAQTHGVPTYHIESEQNLHPDRIQHQPVPAQEAIETMDWLPAGPVRVGFTAGASTPDTKLAAVIERVVELGGEDLGQILAG